MPSAARQRLAQLICTPLFDLGCDLLQYLPVMLVIQFIKRRLIENRGWISAGAGYTAAAPSITPFTPILDRQSEP